MRGIWRPLLKLIVYTVTIALATSVLTLVIVNERFTPTNTYTAQFTDASGILPNSDVRIAGVTVGKVESVDVTDDNRATVEFTVAKDEFVPRSVRIAVKYKNLIGDRYLELERGPGSAAELPDGANIPASRTQPAVNLTVLFQGFRPLFEGLQPAQVNQLADEILRTLQGEGGTINQLLAHTASLTNTIADRDRVIGQLVDNLNQVLGTVSARDAQLATLVTQLQRLVSGLSANREAIGESVQSVSQLTNSVAGLLGEARPPLKADIEHLSGLAANLNRGSKTVDHVLRNLPTLLNEVDRTASYGSWFQFYLCQAGGTINLPKPLPNKVVAYQNAAARCSG